MQADETNLVAPLAQAAGTLVRPLAALHELDLAPRAVPLSGVSPLSPQLAKLPGATSDFLGRARGPSLIGACLPAGSGAAPCR